MIRPVITTVAGATFREAVRSRAFIGLLAVFAVAALLTRVVGWISATDGHLVATDLVMSLQSVIGVLVFAGLTAWDTQKIKEMYYVGDDGTVAGRKAIMGALSLYLDFINMFQFLLALFGNRNE